MCHLTPEGRIAEHSLLQLRAATSTALKSVLCYASTVDREATRLIGPRNFPRHKCSQCDAAYDTLQRKALHEFAAHGIRNARRAAVLEARCPYCEQGFASLETARRHVVGNVCGQVPPQQPAGTEASLGPRTVLQMLQARGGT